MTTNTNIDQFLAARDFLLRAKSYDEARAGFRWPDLIHFNWALDYFDRMALNNAKTALIIVDENGLEIKKSFDDLRRRSNQAANFFKDQGIEKEDCILLMMTNSAELLETMLAAIKIGAVITPASTLLTAADIEDRIRRGQVKCIVADAAMADRIESVGDILKTVRLKVALGGEPRHGWTSYAAVGDYADTFTTSLPTYSTDPCLLYFTSGTTSHPKMVMHTHVSYPVGHLVTMFWIGIKESDIHYNISAPGWGKHAWSSLFSPWNAGATIFIYRYERFNARQALEYISRYKITTLCAPPTVWRRFLIEDLKPYKFSLREIVSAGEPLNPEIIDKIRQATDITIREGYGQTETVLQIGTFPGMPVKSGAMGKAAPGFNAQVVNSTLMPQPVGQEGQLALRICPERPMGLMKGYHGDHAMEDDVFMGGWYLSGDVAKLDKDGYFWFVGRHDDVFKSSDYRISPFEIESELLTHPAVAEAAVVASSDPERGLVPKAFIALRPGYQASPDLALDVFRFCRRTMAPYKRPRRLEFMEDLLKTISGKIKRAELRRYDDAMQRKKKKAPLEFYESDFDDILKKHPHPQN